MASLRTPRTPEEQRQIEIMMMITGPILFGLAIFSLLYSMYQRTGQWMPPFFAAGSYAVTWGVLWYLIPKIPRLHPYESIAKQLLPALALVLSWVFWIRFRNLNPGVNDPTAGFLIMTTVYVMVDVFARWPFSRFMAFMLIIAGLAVLTLTITLLVEFWPQLVS